jgi:hypothetical protein
MLSKELPGLVIYIGIKQPFSNMKMHVPSYKKQVEK